MVGPSRLGYDKHPQRVTDKTDKTPFVSFGGSLQGVNAKKQGGATPTFQDLFLLAARAGFPEYRVNDPWVFIPEGKEAWQRNLQSMFRTFPQDLPRVLAWLEADPRLMQTGLGEETTF